MRDYKPLRRSPAKKKARVLSDTGVIVVLLSVLIVALVVAATYYVQSERQKPLPAPISDKAMLKQATETERRL